MDRRMFTGLALAVGLAAGAAADSAHAQLTVASPATIVNPSVSFTFGGIPTGAWPYLPLAIQGGAFDGVDVTFSSYFAGQTPVGTGQVTISGSPTPGAPLQLQYGYDPSSGDCFNCVEIAVDSNAPYSAVLAGLEPDFLAPISILFSVPIPEVALDIGSMNGTGAVTIQAFDADGDPLGSVDVSPSGYQTYGLTDAGGPGISGLTLFGSSANGFEPFAIDNVILAGATIPEPATVWLVLLGLAGLAYTTASRRALPV